MTGVLVCAGCGAYVFRLYTCTKCGNMVCINCYSNGLCNKCR